MAKAIKDITEREFNGYFTRKQKPNDLFQTPLNYCEAIVNHFQPSGKILEPCCGEGNFLKFLPVDTDWCEINLDIDFFDYNKKVDWIITNPPFSKMRFFMKKAFQVADNVVFFTFINHLFMHARMRLLEQYNFGIKEILVLNRPHPKTNFPEFGFVIGCFHLQKNYAGEINFSKIKMDYDFTTGNKFYKQHGFTENLKWNQYQHNKEVKQ